MKSKLVVAVVIIVVIAALFGAMKLRQKKAPSPSTGEIWAKEGIPVETGAVFTGSMARSVETTGNIEALEKISLSAKIPGRLAEFGFREGDQVAAGTVVATLDQQDALNNLRQAQSGLDSAETRLSQALTGAKVTRTQTDAAISQANAGLSTATAQLELAKAPTRSQEKMIAENGVASAKANLDNAAADLRRSQQLYDQGAIPQSSLDLSKTQHTVAENAYNSAQQQLAMINEGGREQLVRQATDGVRNAEENLRQAKANAAQNMLRQEDIKAARAGVRNARAMVDMAKQNLSYTYVKSPISGVISARYADSGQVVGAGMPICDIVNLNTLYLQGDVSEKDIGTVSRGQRVDIHVDAFPAETFSGIVAEMYPSGSTKSRNFQARIRIVSGSDKLRPAMFARGTIVSGLENSVVLVPKDAIDTRKGAKMVFKVMPDNTVKRYDIEVIREDDKNAQIKAVDGLKPGDIVVTAGRQSLDDGSKVRAEKAK